MALLIALSLLVSIKSCFQRCRRSKELCWYTWKFALFPPWSSQSAAKSPLPQKGCFEARVVVGFLLWPVFFLDISSGCFHSQDYTFWKSEPSPPQEGEAHLWRRKISLKSYTENRLQKEQNKPFSRDYFPLFSSLLLFMFESDGEAEKRYLPDPSGLFCKARIRRIVRGAINLDSASIMGILQVQGRRGQR